MDLPRFRQFSRRALALVAVSTLLIGAEVWLELYARSLDNSFPLDDDKVVLAFRLRAIAAMLAATALLVGTLWWFLHSWDSGTGGWQGQVSRIAVFVAVLLLITAVVALSMAWGFGMSDYQ